MATMKKIIAEVEKIHAVEVRIINGVEMFEVSQLEKAFNRTFKSWVNQQYAHDFIKALAFVKHLQNNDTVHNMDARKICGNMAFQYDGGRWLCREVFVEFARWLSPYFAVQCDLYCSPLIPKLDGEDK